VTLTEPIAATSAIILSAADPARLLAFLLIGAGILYLLVMLLLARGHRQHRGTPSADLFYVFVMPCLEEESVVGASLARLLSVDRDDIRVLVVDDGSDDATSDIVRAVPDERVWLLRRELPQARSGKGAALNAAIAYLTTRPEVAARDPDNVIIVVVDADGRLDPHAIEAVAPYFGDPRTAGVQTGVRINNRSGSLLARMQDIEFVVYTHVFQRGRGYFDNVGLGGNGQFVRLSALRSLGSTPWSHSLTEDLDLGVRLLLKGWRNQYCPLADVHQQGVVRLRRLFRQRSRWFQGHLQAWRLIPQVIRQAKTRTLPDMLVHISSPVLILLASLLTAAFVLSMLASLTTWLAGGPAPDPRAFVGAYLTSAFPALLCGVVYWRRERLSGFGVVRLVGYSHLYILYAFIWFIAGWWAVGRMVSGRKSWHKTARSAEEQTAPPLTAVTVPLLSAVTVPALPAVTVPRLAMAEAGRVTRASAADDATATTPGGGTRRTDTGRPVTPVGHPPPPLAARDGPKRRRWAPSARTARTARPARTTGPLGPLPLFTFTCLIVAELWGLAHLPSTGEAPRRWVDGSRHGAWIALFDGYGETTARTDGTDQVISLAPRAAAAPSTTHAGLVVSADHHTDVRMSVQLRTLRQLRIPGPASWEVGWVLWNYTDPARFYAFALKPNGWELSKQDPAYPGGQRFLASGEAPRVLLTTWHTIEVTQTDNTIAIDVDGVPVAVVTDSERPYLAGAVGLYCEDSVVEFRRVQALSGPP
jgi:cellulose synthase/poly-beta-1,6-N-acetylglucosamine synthase-like glycosyltransferase